MLGLYNELKHPDFTWDIGMHAVKQGPAHVSTLILSLVSADIPLIASVFAGPEIVACIRSSGGSDNCICALPEMLQS